MISEKLTKIVATLGPASDSPETIREMISSGVNVFRFNTKHGTVDWHEQRIQRVQKIADEMKATIGILVDLQGPEIRLETIDKLPYPITKGETVNFTPSFVPEICSICIPHDLVFSTLKKGDQVLIDDGSIELTIEEVSDNLIKAVASDDGEIGHRKGVNFPGVQLDLPSLIYEDLRKLDMATTNKVDFIALSFSRTKEDLDILRKEMRQRKVEAMVVAKIESMQALNNIDELIHAADAVMVARGDLGIEVPIEQLAYWQKTIIRKCREAKKPVITATQMLQSMTNSLRPTRSEATDVANAVLDGTDALMLSGETASGKYPVKAVQAMAKIAHFNETIAPEEFFETQPENEADIVIDAIERMMSQKLVKVKFILVFTKTGLTAKAVSRLRPRVPILAVTREQKTIEELTLSYAVKSIKSNMSEGEFRLPNPIIDQLISEGKLEKGESIIVIHGQNYYVQGSTNAVALIKV